MFINTTATNKIDPKRVHIYNLAVAKVWLLGEPTILERFYKHDEKTLNPYLGMGTISTDGFFWRNVVPKYHKTHSGLPRLVVNRIKDLVNTGYNLVSEDEDAIETLNKILKDNQFNNSLFDKGITDESWAGHTAYKFAFDEDLSNMPIIESIEPEQLEIVKKRGRVQKYIINFTDNELKKDDNTYHLEEIYQFINKVPTITYKAYSTAKKEDIVEQDKYTDIPLIGLNFLPVFLKNNTTTNVHPEIPFGMSDFGNNYSLLDDMDECQSQQSHKLRHANPKRFISEALIDMNDAGQVSNFNDFETDYIVTKEELNDSQRELLEQHTSKIEADEYIKTYKKLEAQVLANMGISPLTIGNSDAAGLNNNGDTLREREKLSMRTRNAKLKLWKPFLEDMFVRLLMFNDWVNANTSTIGEYNFEVTFNPFEELSIKEEIETLGDAKLNGLVSTRTAVTQLNPELNEAELNTEIVRVKTENGVAVLEEDLIGVEVPTEE